MTTAQLNNKLTEFGVEFRKIADSDDATEAMRWIVNAQEFLGELLCETKAMKSLSEREHTVISEIECIASGRCFEMKQTLLARIRRESSLK